MLALAMVSPIQATLTIEQIHSESGFAEIKMGEVEIVDRFDIILHIIHPKEILDIITSLEDNIKNLSISSQGILLNRVQSLRIKTSTLLPKTLLPERSKRGLINAVGKGFKWLFGTLDEDDKLSIESHLKITDENNHKVIETVNEQIKINENFNNSFSILKNILESDRNKIVSEFETINSLQKKILEREIFLEQQLRVQTLQEYLEKIQDNIVSARVGIAHPSILSEEEIENYKIDIKKLSNIKVGIAKLRDDAIVFAIKIPTRMVQVNKKLIIPIANSNNKQIDDDIEYLVRIKNKTFTFQNNFSSQELQLSKHCIIKKNCKLINSPEEEIIEIGNDFVVLNNIKNKHFASSCDEREVLLSGNFIINFVNCSINVGTKTFYNNILEFTERFVIPNKINITLHDHTLNFENITLHQENNLKVIKELKLHNIVNYSLGTGSIVLVIVILLIIVCKRKAIEVKMIRENHQLKDGRVTLPNNNDQHNAINVGHDQYVRPEVLDFVRNLQRQELSVNVENQVVGYERH